jgi:uncharacterized protein (DUF2147 family)
MIRSRAGRRHAPSGLHAAARRCLWPFLLALGSAPLQAAEGVAPEGLWLTDDRTAVVRIAPCGSNLCGTVTQVLARGRDVPTTDINNPDPKLRLRPLNGLRTLWGFSRSGSAWKGGRAYDPKSGKSYRTTLQLNRDGSLKVSGCVLFVCDSRRWTRYRP